VLPCQNIEVSHKTAAVCPRQDPRQDGTALIWTFTTCACGTSGVVALVLRGGAVVRLLDLRLTGHGFNSQPVRFHVT